MTTHLTRKVRVLPVSPKYLTRVPVEFAESNLENAYVFIAYSDAVLHCNIGVAHLMRAGMVWTESN